MADTCRNSGRGFRIHMGRAVARRGSRGTRGAWGSAPNPLAASPQDRAPRASPPPSSLRPCLFVKIAHLGTNALSFETHFILGFRFAFKGSANFVVKIHFSKPFLNIAFTNEGNKKDNPIFHSALSKLYLLRISRRCFK